MATHQHNSNVQGCIAMGINLAQVVAGPDERRQLPDVSLEDTFVNGVLFRITGGGRPVGCTGVDHHCLPGPTGCQLIVMG